MATLQSGKCFTVPTFFGMCCKSEWQERMYIYKWHEVDQTKHEIFCVHIVCNEIQVKVNLEITTFFFLFAFSILSQLFLIWVCRSLSNTWWLLVNSSSSVRNLGILFDSNLSFEKHVSSICKTAFFHLKNISKLRPMLSMSNAESESERALLPSVFAHTRNLSWC